MQLTHTTCIDFSGSKQDDERLRVFDCPEGFFHDLATLTFNREEAMIKTFFHGGFQKFAFLAIVAID